MTEEHVHVLQTRGSPEFNNNHLYLCSLVSEIYFFGKFFHCDYINFFLLQLWVVSLNIQSTHNKYLKQTFVEDHLKNIPVKQV